MHIALALKELPSEEKKACLFSLMETLAGKWRGYATVKAVFRWIYDGVVCSHT